MYNYDIEFLEEMAQKMRKRLFCNLAELQHGVDDNKPLETMLKNELSLLYNLLGDTVPEEYWEQIEEFI